MWIKRRVEFVLIVPVATLQLPGGFSQCQVERLLFQFPSLFNNQLGNEDLENIPAICLTAQCSSWVMASHARQDKWISIKERRRREPRCSFSPSFYLLQLIVWNWWWLGGRMYDVIYFNVWSDIICTAAKLLHGTSAFEQMPFFKTFLQVFIVQVSKNGRRFASWLRRDMTGPGHSPCPSGCMSVMKLEEAWFSTKNNEMMPLFYQLYQSDFRRGSFTPPTSIRAEMWFIWRRRPFKSLIFPAKFQPWVFIYV